jgi:hypothetical protein
MRVNTSTYDLSRAGPERWLAITGLILIALGMLFGDVFAVFILHPNNARIGAEMYAAAELIPAGDAAGIVTHFQAIGGFLENRGTKVDAHSHMVHMGYIALLLALLQPAVQLSDGARRALAKLFIVSAALLPPSIFAIHYVGLQYSPFGHIGWASVAADLFGALLAVAVAGQLLGLWRGFRGSAPVSLSVGDNRSARLLLCGGLLLLSCGFVYGAWYALSLQQGVGGNEVELLKNIVSAAAAADTAAVDQGFAAYGGFLAWHGINVAAHAHVNEAAILLLLIAFAQRHIHYTESTRHRWAVLAVVSAFGLPAGILLEIPYGVVGSVIADLSGLGLIVSLTAMLFGLLRRTGAVDANAQEDV